MDLIELWNVKARQGEVLFDPDPLVISPSSLSRTDWGTVYYSSARESYKSQVSVKPSTSFDLELMARLHLADHGGLVVAANPNSLFEGHLVIYPKQKSPELTREDLLDVTRLAHEQPGITFIHNAERSAASIIDWAHFQGYAIDFPIEKAPSLPFGEVGGIDIQVVADEFPAYAITFEDPRPEVVADLLYSVCSLLRDAVQNGERIPLNLIWRRERVWIIPRAEHQSEIAARYFGGLEMGGIFCLPRKDDLGSYLPTVLRQQVESATLRSPAEKERRESFEVQLKTLNDARP